MNKSLLLLLALVLIVALVVLTVPAFSQTNDGAAAPGGSVAPADPGASGGPAKGPGGGPLANGHPAAAHGAKPGPDPVKAAPKIGLFAAIIGVVAIGIVLVMKKKQA